VRGVGRRQRVFADYLEMGHVAPDRVVGRRSGEDRMSRLPRDILPEVRLAQMYESVVNEPRGQHGGIDGSGSRAHDTRR